MLQTYLDILLKVLVQQYFATPKCFLLIQDNQSNLNLNVPLGSMVVNFEVSNITFKNFGCQHFILNVIEPEEALELVEKELRLHSESFNKRKYIVFKIDANKNDGFQIFKTRAAKFVSDIVFVQMELIGDSLVGNFWTHKYTGATDSYKPILIDKWFSMNNSFAFNRNLFYNKLANLEEKRLKVGTFDYRPYVLVANDTTVFSGADIHLVQTIVQQINASVEFIIQEDRWGYVFSNGTSYGVKGDIYKDIVDVGAAGFYMTKGALKDFGLTKPYLMEEITCLVPAPKLVPSWLSPYYSFSKATWAMLIITQISLGFTVYLITYFKTTIFHKNNLSYTPIQVQKIIAAVTKPLVLQPITRRNYYFKPLMSIVMIAMITISVGYDAGFASTLTKPSYEHPIDTLEDFLGSDLPWGNLQTADWVWSWENSTQKIYRKAAKRYVATTSKKLQELSKKGNFGFKMQRVSGQLHVNNFIKSDVLNKYRVMKESLDTQHIMLLLRKHSILIPIFNKIISRLLESGIINFWTDEYNGHEEYIVQKKLHSLKNSAQQQRVMLKLSHVIGVFGVLVLGCTTGLVIFVVEIMLEKSKIK